MMNDIKVFGHRSPDTDATCSAIVWAWFLNNHRNQPATPYILGSVNTEAEFVLESWGVTMPDILESVDDTDTVAIVDTNNLDELFENINDTQIVSIVDHHKLSGKLKTNLPLELVIQPYASTMTVMYNIMNIEPNGFPREIAGLMLSGILSDTLAFRSPTTTQDDKELAHDLARFLDITIDDYASQMFDAKSNISGFSAQELLRMDSKIYEIKGMNTRVSVLETTNPGIILNRYDELVAAMPQIQSEDAIEQIVLFIIDIIREESILLVPNETIRELAEQSFGVPITGTTVVLPGVVSRKKQILPALL